MMDMDWSILLVSLSAVGTMVVMASGGAMLRSKGVMTPQVSKGLGEVSMALTIPCLLFTTAVDCTQDDSSDECLRVSTLLHKGWPMLLLPIVYVSCGVLCGYVAAYVGKAEANFRRSAIAAVAFGNSTGLPITLLAVIHSHCKTGSDIKAVNPVLFLSIYLVLYPVLQWSVGSWLLKPQSARDDAACAGPPAIFEADPPMPTLMPEGWTAVRAETEMEWGHAATWHPAESAPKQHEHLPRHKSCPQQGTAPAPAQAEVTVKLEEGRHGGPWETSEKPVAVGKVGRRATLLTIARRVLPPPVRAALLGMTVAFVEPARGIFVGAHGAPLAWLFLGLSKLGAAAVPINMLILGNAVAKGAGRAVSLRTALAVAVGKVVVMPLIGLGLVLAMKHREAIPDGTDDSFYLVAMVVTATPTANNMMVMAELAGENKEGLATCIFIQYLACPVLLTMWLAIFVHVATF